LGVRERGTAENGNNGDERAERAGSGNHEQHSQSCRRSFRADVVEV
jgi:hypothetical protein